MPSVAPHKRSLLFRAAAHAAVALAGAAVLLADGYEAIRMLLGLLAGLLVAAAIVLYFERSKWLREMEWARPAAGGTQLERPSAYLRRCAWRSALPAGMLALLFLASFAVWGKDGAIGVFVVASTFAIYGGLEAGWITRWERDHEVLLARELPRRPAEVPPLLTLPRSTAGARPPRPSPKA